MTLRERAQRIAEIDEDCLWCRSNQIAAELEAVVRECAEVAYKARIEFPEDAILRHFGLTPAAKGGAE